MLNVNKIIMDLSQLLDITKISFVLFCFVLFDMNAFILQWLFYKSGSFDLSILQVFIQASWKESISFHKNIKQQHVFNIDNKKECFLSTKLTY